MVPGRKTFALCVCGGIKHSGRFLLTRCTLPSPSCIYSRPSVQLNLPSPSQSSDVHRRTISKMMKWLRNTDREADEELVKV